MMKFVSLSFLIFWFLCGPAWAGDDPSVIACKSNLKNLGTAFEMYSSDNGGKYPRTAREVTPSYLRSMPKCPAAGRDTYSKSYKLVNKGKKFVIHCQGHNHAVAGYPKNQPSYNSVEGLARVKPRAANVKGAWLTIPENGPTRYRFKLPKGWLKKSGNSMGVSLGHSTYPKASLSCGLVSGRKDVAAWYKETLAGLREEGLRPISPRRHNIGNLKGFYFSLVSKGKKMSSYSCTDGKQNFMFILSAPQTQFKKVSGDLDRLLGTLKPAK